MINLSFSILSASIRDDIVKKIEKFINVQDISQKLFPASETSILADDQPQ